MIYLDNAATTRVDENVLDAMLPYLKEEYGNPGSLHSIGKRAKTEIDSSRESIANFLNCNAGQVIFTSGGSEGNNLIMGGIENELRKRGKTTVVISEVEHDSLWKSAHKLCSKDGFKLKVCHPNKYGIIEPTELSKLIDDSVGIVSVMMVNNETGAVNNISDLVKCCDDRGILFHTDAVQGAGFIKLDTRELGVDFLTISSHKINGPKGVGAIYAKNPGLLSPVICGGDDQEFGLRGGTENVAGIVGFSVASAIADKEREKRASDLNHLFDVLYSQLLYYAESKHVKMIFNSSLTYGVPKILNICFPGIESETLLLALDNEGVCVSAGSACRAREIHPSRVLTAMGVSEADARSSIRISISHDNSVEDLKTAAIKIIECVSILYDLRYSK